MEKRKSILQTLMVIYGAIIALNVAVGTYGLVWRADILGFFRACAISMCGAYTVYRPNKPLFKVHRSRKGLKRGAEAIKAIPENSQEAKEKPDESTAETSLISVFLNLKAALINTEIGESVSRLYEIAYAIETYINKNPNDKVLIREYSAYYLPTTINLLSKYLEFFRVKDPSDEILNAKTEIQQSIAGLLPVYQQSLQKLYQEDVLDVSADIKVLNSKLDEKKREAVFAFIGKEKSERAQ